MCVFCLCAFAPLCCFSLASFHFFQSLQFTVLRLFWLVEKCRYSLTLCAIDVALRKNCSQAAKCCRCVLSLNSVALKMWQTVGVHQPAQKQPNTFSNSIGLLKNEKKRSKRNDTNNNVVELTFRLSAADAGLSAICVHVCALMCSMMLMLLLLPILLSSISFLSFFFFHSSRCCCYI